MFVNSITLIIWFKNNLIWHLTAEKNLFSRDLTSLESENPSRSCL